MFVTGARAQYLDVLAQEPQKVRDAYGPSQFGEQALVARRLVEAGVPFVRVGRMIRDANDSALM